MESKKINQLATELTPSLSDLTIIGDPSTGISKKITLSQMASLFTGTVEEYANLAAFPLVGVADTIYIALDTNIIYRWNTGTNAYVELSPNIVTSLVFNDANGFDGTISLVGSTATLTITTALTTGSVGFIGASGALLQDNANFFWDDTNNRLGIGTNAPTTAIDAFGSGIIGRLNGTSTNNAFLGFASAGTNKWSIGNVQSDQRFRIYSEANTAELVSVLQTGEFGIGIANPTTKLHIDSGASALIANLDANVSVAKSISFRSDNSNRINLEVSGTESGSNAGADLFIRRYSDAGALIDTPFYIKRSTGFIGLGTITPTNPLHIVSNSVSQLNVAALSGNTNAQINLEPLGTGSAIIGPASEFDLYFRTNNINRLIVSKLGFFGVGTDSAVSGLNSVNMQLSTGSGNSSFVDFGIFNLAALPTTSASTRLSLGFLSGNSSYVPTGIDLGSVVFYGQGNEAGYGGAAITANVTTGGNVSRNNHVVDLVFRTKRSAFTGVEDKMKLTGAGVLDLLYGQVKFPATQNASTDANTLDDYEEGTFTPTLGGTSTYAAQYGNYTKIGNKVYIKIYFIVNSIGTGSAQTISGLPFTCDNTITGYSIYVGAFQDLSTARVFMGGRVNQNSSDVAMRTTAAAAIGVAAANIFQNNSTIEIGGFYGV
jgi:hypothetical protein